MQRTDRALIVIALVMLLVTIGVFNNFDRLFSHGSGNRKDVIAEIVSGDGDARVKYKNEFHWQKARTRDGLIFDDSVFAGPNSHIELKVGESRLSLDPNTLIVLRKDDKFKTFKFDYGSLKGVLSRSDKIYVESEGQRLELSSQSNAKVNITKKDGNTRIEVKSGSAKVVRAGKAHVVTAAEPLVIKAPARRAQKLEWVSPKLNLFYTNSAELNVDFRWRYAGRKAIEPEDAFTLEFSLDPEFTRLVGQETRQSEDHALHKIARDTSLYARVTNTFGESTPVRQIMVRALNAPTIVQPLAEAEVSNALVKLAGVPPMANAWTQVARDADFKDLLVNKTTSVAEFATPLAPGEYYVRARSLVEEGRVQSNWSVPTHFYVAQPIDLERITKQGLPARIFIANQKYPAALYHADDAKIQAFLSPVEPQPKFFAPLQEPGLTLVISRAGHDDPEQDVSSPKFPPEWLYPGTADVRYRLESRRTTKTTIVYQNTHRVQIELEAPNQLTATPEGRFAWSPVLFARSYEGQLRAPSGVITAFTSRLPAAKLILAQAGATYAYRVRALGRDHEPITAWSRLETLQTPAPPAPPAPIQDPVPMPIAEEPAPPARAPAQEALVTKLDVPAPESWLHRMKTWLWAGMGYNVIDVRQTVAGTADIRYQNTHGPSENIEAGFLAPSGIGAVVAYSRLPGEIKVDQPIDRKAFVWDTYSAEVLARLGWHPHFFNREVNVAVRAGAQYHQFPFLHVENQYSVIQGRNNMTTASLGFMSETVGRLKYHWSMRYQQPLQTNSEGGNNFSVSPIVAFDGAVGTSYLLTQTWKTGLFWYGQFHDYKYSYTSLNQPTSGSQSLFYSALELRLGYDF